MDDGTPRNATAAKVLGFIALGLGCTMLIAAFTAPLPNQQRIALGVLGIFGCYWGMRFQRLGRSG